MSVAMGGDVGGCRSTRTEVSGNAEITMVFRTRTTVPQLNRVFVDTMRAAGWRLQAVNVAQGRMRTIPHPACTLARGGWHGAVNILPGRPGGAEALVFISLPCFDAGDHAVSLARGTASRAAQ